MACRFAKNRPSFYILLMAAVPTVGKRLIATLHGDMLFECYDCSGNHYVFRNTSEVIMLGDNYLPREHLQECLNELGPYLFRRIIPECKFYLAFDPATTFGYLLAAYPHVKGIIEGQRKLDKLNKK